MPSTHGDRIVIALASAVLGFAVGIPTGAAITADDAPWNKDLNPYHHQSTTTVTVAPVPVKPTDSHTTVSDDDPSFSCVDDGNRICGPGNAQGAPAGQYDEGGVLIFTWDQLLAIGIVKEV